MPTVIEGGTVIAYRDGGHAIMPGGQVVYEGDTITFVGRGYDGPADERIDALYLSGGAAQTPELAQRLAERVEAPVEVTDPFSRVHLSSSIDPTALQRRASEFAVALGLSVRRPGDK